MEYIAGQITKTAMRRKPCLVAAKRPHLHENNVCVLIHRMLQLLFDKLCARDDLEREGRLPARNGWHDRGALSPPYAIIVRKWPRRRSPPTVCRDKLRIID